MLDIKFIRSDPEAVKESLRKRGGDTALVEAVLNLDKEKRELMAESEQLKNRRNVVSDEIAALKKSGGDAQAKILEMREVSQTIKDMDEKLRRLDAEMTECLMGIPNVLHKSVPEGESDEDNRVIREWGSPTAFDFEPLAHWDIGEHLGLLDFERAGKIAGARFTVYRDLGAKLERALVNFMLDLHTGQHGYTEIFPPFLVNRGSMEGTGQLPKFEQDMFKVEGSDYYLIPTAEVPVTNLLREEIVPEADLPIKYAAYSACFRAEAGAHGRDTRGLIRQHQFNKVELVKFAHPDTSYEELETLTGNAERVLELLELPYRTVVLCSGDVGFSSAKTYDVEVWMPSYGTYREISSCSNFEDFQARRANIRFKPSGGGKPRFVHTLNGSGVAVGRTVAAILENYQEEDGTVEVPEVLRPYLGGLEKLG
ncbi:MAG: serine--tRNA ligase [Bacillota bacterium]|jgi:seryl-tRNA synthetase